LPLYPSDSGNANVNIATYAYAYVCAATDAKVHVNSNSTIAGALRAEFAEFAALAPLAPQPQVTCLTVTQQGREASLALAVGDFVRQSYAARDLLILHDGDKLFHQYCEQVATSARERGAEVSLHRVDPGLTLGQLRNESVARAKGRLLCQWDDDDRSHPDRLLVQVETLLAASASAVFLTQQLHFFTDTNELFCEDWSREPYPLDVVQGSAMVRRDVMPQYPDLRRGEDTALLNALIGSGQSIARVRDKPWLYCYTFHGGNTFLREHHANAVRANGLSPAAMMNIRVALDAALAQFEPPIR
jgi:glycosyltransferase involved in cell wall biosynthesis